MGREVTFFVLFGKLLFDPLPSARPKVLAIIVLAAL